MHVDLRFIRTLLTLAALHPSSIPPISEGAETMYYFTSLALTLNELEEGVAPTDSRRRPDQRLMEDGRWDEANSEKQRLEEKQRGVRREREREAASQRTSSQSEEGLCLVSVFRCVCVPFCHAGGGGQSWK